MGGNNGNGNASCTDSRSKSAEKNEMQQINNLLTREEAKMKMEKEKSITRDIPRMLKIQQNNQYQQLSNKRVPDSENYNSKMRNSNGQKYYNTRAEGQKKRDKKVYNKENNHRFNFPINPVTQIDSENYHSPHNQSKIIF